MLKHRPVDVTSAKFSSWILAVFGKSEVSYFSELRNFTWSIKILSCRLVDAVQFLSDWNTWAKLVTSSYTITQDALLLSKCILEVILVFLNFIMWIAKGTFSTLEVWMQFPNAATVVCLNYVTLLVICTKQISHSNTTTHYWKTCAAIINRNSKDDCKNNRFFYFGFEIG